jgi:hypothetical protein
MPSDSRRDHHSDSAAPVDPRGHQGLTQRPADTEPGALLQARARHDADGTLRGEWAVPGLRSGMAVETPCGTLCGEDALIQDQDGSLCGACWLAKERNGQDEPSGSCSPEPEASIPGLRGAGAELEGL